MKIKLIMEKRNLTVDLESEKAEALFNAFALKLLGIEERTGVKRMMTDTVLLKDHCTTETPAIKQKLPDIVTDQRISAPIREAIRHQEAVNETKKVIKALCISVARNVGKLEDLTRKRNHSHFSVRIAVL